jgi:hypothetical protein
MARRFQNGIDLTGNKAINVASPTALTDGANKGYVDNALAGLSWKADVRVATTTNGTLATAYANGQTIDGQVLATGDRILIKNQTTQTENGIYVVAVSGAPTRSTDADATNELNNATVTVLQGTTNALTSWTQTTPNPVIGSSNIVFATYAAGTVYTAAATGGLQLSSGAFSVLLPANSGLATSGSGTVVQLDTAPGLVLGAGGLKVLLDPSNPALQLTSGLKVIAGAGISTAGNSVAIDTSVVVRKFAQSIGNGSLTAIPVTHGLGTLDVQVQVYDNATFETVECDTVRTSTTVVTLTFATAPATNAYRVLVQG